MRSLRARILSEMTSFSLRDQEEEAEDIWWNKQGRLRRQVVQVWNRSLRLRTIQHESMMYYGPAHQTTLTRIIAGGWSRHNQSIQQHPPSKESGTPVLILS